MAHDVFISYSSRDKPKADAVCAGLEAEAVRCWIAPRDILPGQSWGEAIIEAIGESRAMVLIFSQNADRSPQVLREVERAVHKDVIVIPFRIEDCAPSKSMEYFLSTPHWLDALTPDLEGHIRQLAATVVILLNRRPAPPPPGLEAGRRDEAPAGRGIVFEEAAPDEWSRTRRKSLWNRFLSFFDDR
jgi:hypothetical protein